MKKILSLILCFCIAMSVVVFTAPSINANAAYNINGGWASSATFIIDPGHGGSDPGAVNGSRHEADDVLRLSLKVGEYIIKAGETVNFTRVTDITQSLWDKCNMQLNGSYRYFLSIHRNAASASALGIETFYYNGCSASSEDARFATEIQNRVQPASGMVNRGVKSANFQVIRETNICAALTEVGFITNSTDNALFDKNFDAIALAIANGCLAMVGKSVPTLTDKLNGNSPDKSIPSGCYVKLESQQTNKYLTRLSDNTVFVKPENDSLDQIWKMTKHSDGTYSLINAGNGYALDIYGAATATGSRINVHQTNSSNAQKFYVYNYGGGYHFRACYLQNMVLDISLSNEWSHLWTVNDSAAQQRFTIHKVDVVGVLPLLNLNDFTTKLKLSNGKYFSSDGSNALVDDTGIDWTVKRNTNGTYSFADPDGNVLDCSGAKFDEGTNVMVHTPNGGKNQEFYLYKLDGKYVLKPNGGTIYGEAVVVDVNASTSNVELHRHSTSDVSKTAQRYELVMDKPIVGKYEIRNLTSMGYDVYAEVSGNVQSASIPTWSSANDQDDVIWYDAPINNGIINYHVNLSKHNYETGKFNSHIYVYNQAGQHTAVTLSAEVPAHIEPSIADVEVSNITCFGYDVTFKVAGTFTKIELPTWTDTNGQDDLSWYVVTDTAGVAKIHINTEKHNNEIGKYFSHIYLTNLQGTRVKFKELTITVPSPTVPSDADYIPIEKLNENANTSASQLWTTGTFTAVYWGVLVLAPSADGYTVTQKYLSGETKSVAASGNNPLIVVHSGHTAYAAFSTVEVGQNVTLEGVNVSKGLVLSGSFVKLPYGFVLKDDSKYTMKDDGSKFLKADGKNKTAKEISAQFKCTVRVFGINNTELGNAEVCGTGSVVRYYGSDGSLKDSAQIVINGDINGDGTTTASDCLMQQSYLQSSTTLDSVFLLAADYDGNGSVTAADFLSLATDIINGN